MVSVSASETGSGATALPAAFGWQSSSEQRLFFATFALLGLMSLAPIWLLRFHPLVDLGCHLAAVSVWLHHDDPAYHFAQYYDLVLGPAPYWLHYGLLRLLAIPLGLDLANRVALSLYVLSLPGGLLLLSRRFERSPWLSLFAFPLVWNFNFNWGFLAFCYGLGLSLFALAAFDAYCARPTVGRGLLAALLGATTYFGHLLPWGFYLASAGLLGLLHRRQSLWRLSGRVAVWLPALALGVEVTLHSRTLGLRNVAHGLHMVFQPYRQSLVELPLRVIDIFVSHEDELVALLLLVSFGLLKLSQRRQPGRGLAEWLHGLRPFACFLVAAVAYFVLPRSLLRPSYWWGINLRFALPAALFLPLCIAGPIAGWRRWLLVPVVAAGLLMGGAVFWHWRDQNRFMAGLDELGRRPEPGARVLVVVIPPYSPRPERTNYLRRAGSSLYQAYYGGYNPHNFDEGFPLRFRQRFPAPSWEYPEQFSFDRHARYYDYLLTFQADPQRLFGSHQADVMLVAAAGRWALWRVLAPRVDRSPGPAYPGFWATDGASPPN